MNIILLGKYRGRPLRYQIGSGWQLALCGAIFAAILAGVGVEGYRRGASEGVTSQLVQLKADLQHQQDLIKKTRASTESNLDALSARMGQMQAHVTRINALGKRLIKIAKIDPAEFDFDKLPGYGGPVDADSKDVSGTTNFESVLDDLNEQLSSREQQLAILENLIVKKQLRHESRPSGRPVKKGWISSYFGMRIDPFTGKLGMHPGIDFAGKEDTKVIAVANGVVTWAGPRGGYGNLVQINHGNGYSTRYGHNDRILVHVGDVVKKGQVISLMGSTGRSTGPHVHFEVLKNDRQINPLSFVQSNG
jgi:murein DD-endopeptidase MepM/ murein hydrolase activator NlpD